METRSELPEAQAALCERLGHRFADPGLLQDALTHSSRVAGRGRSYERLEFLGDRVLGVVVAEMLYRRFPKEPEGALAKRHAALVRRESLALAAAELEVAALVRLSPGEEESGGRENPAILADVCEALFGALYLDGGLKAARRVIEPLWTPLREADLRPPQDNKTALQEWAQGRGLPLPDYVEVGREGPAHEPVFTVEVRIEGCTPARGSGRSKRVAEQAAAGHMLDTLQKEKA